MTERLQRNLPILTFLSKSKPSVIKAFIKTADRDTLDTICECCLNLLKGKVKLSKAQKRKLTPFKNTLRALCKKNITVKKKKQFIQKGGFLGALLAPVLGTVLGAILPR